MKGIVFSCGLVVIGGIALTATLAQAGGGQGGGGGTVTGLQCYEINAEQALPGRTVNLSDQFGNRTVRVGKGRLLCTPTTVTKQAADRDFNFVDPFAADHLKCYSMQERGQNDSNKGNNPDIVVRLTDPLHVETAEVEGARYLCLGAIKERLGP